MGKVIIQKRTTQDPITLIGEEAGVCWGADTLDQIKNFKRGLDCLKNEHGRTFEFPDVYIILDGYSAKVIRELYTHIGGSPTRLQASTRYINYKNFNYIVPESISKNEKALELYLAHMENTANTLVALEELSVPREDSSLVLPFAMETKMVAKYNMRTLMDMSRQRECSRAYWEFRKMFKDIKKALSEYSDEWKYIIDNYFGAKCEFRGFCTEKKSCGRKPTRGQKA